MVLVGIGAGLSFPSIMTLAMTGVKPEEAGLASGLVNTTMQVGGALGLAVLATLSTSRTGNLVNEGHSTASALTSGYQLAFVIAGALLLGALAIALAVLRPEPAAEEATAVESAQAEPAFSSEAL
jgi:MFS family permease